MEEERLNENLLNYILGEILFPTYIDYKQQSIDGSILLQHVFNPNTIYINCFVDYSQCIHYIDNFTTTEKYFNFLNLKDLIDRIEFWLNCVDKYENMLYFFRYNLTEEFINTFKVDCNISDNYIQFFNNKNQDSIIFDNKCIMESNEEELKLIKRTFLSWIMNVIVTFEIP